MLIEITAKGVYGKQEIPVGTRLEVATEPAAWTGKYRVVEEAPKTLEVATPSDSRETEDSEEAPRPKRRGRPRKNQGVDE